MAAAFFGMVSSAHAQYTTVDLSNCVNLGFTNSWFINGSQFSGILGTTNGNQGLPVPFNVANADRHLRQWRL
jgi:hypothetical protein